MDDAQAREAIAEGESDKDKAGTVEPELAKIIKIHR